MHAFQDCTIRTPLTETKDQKSGTFFRQHRPCASPQPLRTHFPLDRTTLRFRNLQRVTLASKFYSARRSPPSQRVRAHRVLGASRPRSPRIAKPRTAPRRSTSHRREPKSPQPIHFRAWSLCPRAAHRDSGTSAEERSRRPDHAWSEQPINPNHHHPAIIKSSWMA